MSQPSRHERAFEVYLALGPDRSLARLAEELRLRPERSDLRRTPSLRSLESWSARHRWQERIEKIEREAREQTEREYLAWLQEHRERLRKEGLFLQQRGLRWLSRKESEDVTAGEAIRAIDVGFKLEGQALSQPTEHDMQEEANERFGRLTDEELEVIIRYARWTGRGGAPGAGQAQT